METYLLDQDSLDSTVIRTRDEFRHPVLSEHMSSDLDDDVVGIQIGVVVVALETLQARWT